MKKLLFLVPILSLSLYHCSSEKHQEKESIEENPYAYFDSIHQEIHKLIDGIVPNVIIDSTTSDGYANFEKQFEDVQLKAFYNQKNGKISSVHYDFFYDSLSNNLERDTDSLLLIIENKFLSHYELNNYPTMKVYSWEQKFNIIDFEMFNNGYSITVRKREKKYLSPKTIDKSIAINKTHIEQAIGLIDLMSGEKLKLNTTSNDEMVALLLGLNLDQYTQTFSKKFDDELLLSVTYSLDKNNKVVALYFDYLYSDGDKDEILATGDYIKDYINSKFDLPTEVATTKMANSYTWHLQPDLLFEVYADGYSIIWEQKTAI